MGVFEVFKIVQMVPHRVMHHHGKIVTPAFGTFL